MINYLSLAKMGQCSDQGVAGQRQYNQSGLRTPNVQMSVQTPVEFVEIGKIMLFDGETTMPWSRFNHPAIVVIDLPLDQSFG